MTDAEIALSRARQIDALCDKFENDWNAGLRPQVEEFAAAAAESEQAAVRSALLSIERELLERSVADTSVSESCLATDAPGSEATSLRTPGAMPIEIGRFEIRGLLGAGAFGVVYQAFDPQLGREVAVKTPIASIPSSGKETARFLKEARAAATINHANICQIHEVGEHAGRPYIVMPLIQGESLADTLKQRSQPLGTRQIALIARKLAIALAAAHAKGIVHRDLKPANIMFDRERKDILVMDFGLARGTQAGAAAATQSGIVMGTPAYMSPEQARGDSKEVGPAGDIYSLGVILYELLTGTRPYNGTATEVIGQILHVDPEAPSHRRAGIDPVLEAACLRAMAKDPAARFASMKEFAAAVDAALKQPARPVPAAAIETARAKETRREGEGGQGSANMSELFAVLSAERKTQQAATVAALDAAVQRSRTPRWMIVATGLLIAGALSVLAGIIFFSRSDHVKVTIELTDVDLADKTFSFFLDDAPISAEELASPIELKPGEHVLVVKRGQEVVKRLQLTVKGGRSPGIKMKDITAKKQDAIVWRSLMPTPEYLATEGGSNHGVGDKVVRLANGNLEMHGSGSAFRPDFAGGTNYIVRAKVLSFSGHSMMFRSRCQPGEPHYGAYLHEPRPGIDLPSCGLGRQDGGWNDLVATMKGVSDTLPIEFALSCFGDRIAIYMNGELMVDCQDASASQGKFHITLTQDSHAVLRDLEVCVLDGTRLTPNDVFPPNTDSESIRALAPTFLTAEMKKANLLKNGDFEVDRLDDWKFESWRNNPAVAAVAGRTRSGRGALKLSFAETDSASLTQKVAVKRHRDYLLSGWIMTKNLRFAERGRGGAQLYVPGGYRQCSNFLPAGDNDWTYFAVVFHSGNRDAVEVQARLGQFAGTVTGDASFDDLCLVELPDANAGFVPLFNGKNLAGWTALGKPNWRWADGRVVAESEADSGMGLLLSDKVYEDFELRLQFRLSGESGSGVYLRTHDDVINTKGQLEVQLLGAQLSNAQQPINKTGSIYSVFTRQADPPINEGGFWNDLRIRLEKRKIQVWINDVQTIDRNLDDASDQFARMPGLTRRNGKIGLQQSHREDAEFRNVFIKQLTSGAGSTVK